MAREMVKQLTADNPVVIFSKSTCGMSHAVKTLIGSFGANMAVYDVDQQPEGEDLEKALEEAATTSGLRMNFPVVFIGKELVGGESEVMRLHVKGQLIPMLKKAGAIFIW